MEYYENNGVLEKYELDVNINKLIYLREQIFLNCSTIKKVKITGSKAIKNASSKFLKHIRNFYEYKEDDTDVIKYDYYDYPEIVDKIDEILMCYKKFSNADDLCISFLNYIENIKDLDDSILTEYISDLKRAIKLILKDTISYNDCLKVLCFFDDDIKFDYCKIKKKNK